MLTMSKGRAGKNIEMILSPPLKCIFIHPCQKKNTLRSWHYTFSSLCALQEGISQVPAPGRCTATTKFIEEVHAPSWAYSSYRRGGVCQPSRSSFSFLYWHDSMPRGVLWCSVLGMGAEISIPNLKALQITEVYPNFSQDQDLQGMLTLKDQSL